MSPSEYPVLSSNAGLIHSVIPRASVMTTKLSVELATIDNIINVTSAGVAHLHNAGASLDQPTKDGLLANDGAVVGTVGRRGNHLHKCVQVRGATHPDEFSDACQLSGQGDRIDWFASAVEVENGTEDDLMVRPVEVTFTQNFDDVSDRILAEQHGAENGLLCRVVMGRGAVGAHISGLGRQGQF